MTLLRTVIIVAFLMSTLGQVLAQTDQSSCAIVYKDATRTLTSDERNFTEWSVHFSQHCEKNGSAKSSSLSGNLGATLKAIPFTASAEAKTDAQKLQEFCKAASAQTFVSSAVATHASTVVVDALKSYNQCRALELTGLTISHDDQHPESVVFYGRYRDRVTKATLDTMVYDRKLVSCTSTNFSWLGTSDTIDDTRQKQIPANFNITCRRIPDEREGAIKYPRVNIAMSTSLGPYSVTLQEDQLNGYTLASQAKLENLRLAEERDGLLKEVANLKAAAAQFDAYSVILYHGNTLGFVGGLFNQNPKIFKSVSCPKNAAQIEPAIASACTAGYQPQYVRGFWDYSGGPCGNTFHELKCVRK